MCLIKRGLIGRLDITWSKGSSVRLGWDQTHTIELEYVIWTCAAISFISLAFNYYFAHHSKMGYWFNIPLLLTASLAAGLYHAFCGVEVKSLGELLA